MLFRWPHMLPFFLFLLNGCGQNIFPDYSNDERVIRGALEEGKFKAEFVVLNRPKSRKPQFESYLWIRGDQFYISINMTRGPAKIRYQQFLHRGVRCPDSQDDLNQDGKLDFEETIRVSGDMIIPFDSFIQEQTKGSEWFPISSKQGAYFYARSGSVAKMLQDLTQSDFNLGDGIGKLASDESLSPEGRVLLIYGSNDNPLLPLACAVFRPEY